MESEKEGKKLVEVLNEVKLTAIRKDKMLAVSKGQLQAAIELDKASKRVNSEVTFYLRRKKLIRVTNTVNVEDVEGEMERFTAKIYDRAGFTGRIIKMSRKRETGELNVEK